MTSSRLVYIGPNNYVVEHDPPKGLLLGRNNYVEEHDPF